jgi:signal transduction histidine kinase
MRTLRGRIAFFYACVIALALMAFAATMYGIFVTTESAEPDPTGEEAREIVEMRSRVLLALGIAVPVGLAVAVGGGVLITRRAFGSLDAVVRTAAVLDLDNIQARIPTFAGAGTEVEQVAAALNGMLGRLEGAVLGLRRFTANAAHELRTPLAVLLGNLELALRRPDDARAARATMEETHEELERLTQLVESLLTLARGDARELPVRAEKVDIGEVLGQVTDLYEVVAQQRGIALTRHAAAPAVIQTDALLLSRILANLVDNACKFTGAGGRIDIYLESGPAGARVCVQDSGPGIAANEQERIFERFYRGTSGRAVHSGFGLGLSLARDLAHTLSGSLIVEPPPPGQPGARFVLQLPPAPSHPEPLLPPPPAR